MNHPGFYGRELQLQHLTDAWTRVIQRGQPELVTLLAESGLGKTRLVHEFYAHIAQASRGPDGLGYWPTQLGQQGQNLLVNPALADVNPHVHMPFLWWGLRLYDPQQRNQALSSALTAAAADLAAHIQDLRRAQALRASLIEGGKLVAGSLIGALPVVGSAFGLAQTALELWGEARKVVGQPAADPLGAERRNLEDLTLLILGDLERVNDPARGATRSPMVWFLDDAQFSPHDPAVVRLFRFVLHSAWTQSWPLLIVLTSWEREWAAQWADVGRESLAHEVARHVSAQNLDWLPTALPPLDDGALEPLVLDTLPGLLPEQRRALLARADGNPLFLDQLLRHARNQVGGFENRDPARPLTPGGLRALLRVSTSLTALVQTRLQSVPGDVQEVVVLSSLQGMRSVQFVTRQVIEELKRRAACQCYQPGLALTQAERPHALLARPTPEVAEFNQRIFFEVATAHLDNLFDGDLVREVLRDVLSALDLTRLPSDLTAADRDLLLDVTAQVLAVSEALAERQQATLACALLCEAAYRAGDVQGATQAAGRVIGAVRRDSQTAARMKRAHWDTVFTVLWERLDIEGAALACEVQAPLAAASGDPWWPIQVARQHGACMAATGEADAAVTELHKAVELARDLWRTDPVRDNVLGLTYTLYSLARHAWHSLDVADRLALMDEAVGLIQSAAPVPHSVLEAWRHHGFFLYAAQLHRNLGQFEDVEAMLAQVAAYLERAWPLLTDARAQLMATEIAQAVGGLFQARNQPTLARDTFGQALHTLRALTRQTPGDDMIGLFLLAELLQDQSATYSGETATSSVEAALSMIEESISILEGMRERYADTSILSALARALRMQAALLADHGRSNDALRVLEGLVALERARCALTPSVITQDQLADSLKLAGGVTFDAGDQSGGLNLLHESLEIRRRILATHSYSIHELELAYVLAEYHRYLGEQTGFKDGQTAELREEALALLLKHRDELSNKSSVDIYLKLTVHNSLFINNSDRPDVHHQANRSVIQASRFALTKYDDPIYWLFLAKSLWEVARVKMTWNDQTEARALLLEARDILATHFSDHNGAHVIDLVRVVGDLLERLNSHEGPPVH